MTFKLYILKEKLENVFHIRFKDINENNIPPNILKKIKQILSSNYKYQISENSFHKQYFKYVEIGPKKLFKTSWNTNVIDIFNKSEYNQPYIYILNDSNNCFNSISDTINLDTNNDTTLTFDYNCNNLNESQISFSIRPQYHEHAEKNYSINFMYENFDINNDNVINVLDIIEIINCIIDDLDCIDYDINYDNQINILDVMILVTFITN